MNKKSNGFTLLEIMVVICIIGIIISIVVLGYSKLITKTKAQVCLSNQRTISIARTYYYIEYGVYAESINDLKGILTKMEVIKGNEVGNLLCPSGGQYTFVHGSSRIICSIEGHN